MNASGSVSQWITELKSGDPEAAHQIWQRYYERLVGLARKKLGASPRLQADEEDVTQNAFNSFFQGVVKGRFPRLDDRDDLWRLLVVITARKAFDQRHQERSLKRGGDVRVQPLSPRSSADGAREHGLHDIIGSEPTPEFAAQIADEYGRLMALLGDHALRQVAIWKMESFGNEEIAAKLGTSLRTVARKLETIRIIWQGELAL